MQASPPNSKGLEQPESSDEADEWDDDWEGLTPEEDWEVPGNSMSPLSQNTELGRAVSDACDEMDTLGGLETGVLEEADQLLKKFGFKTSLFEAPAEEDSAGGDGASAKDSAAGNGASTPG